MSAFHPGRCPDCGYSLKGLPAQHRCPECGFPYDQRTRVWRPRRPWKIYIYVVGIPFLWISLLVNAYVHTFASPDRKDPRLRAAATVEWIVLMTAPVVGLWRAWRSTRRGRFAAITPKGIRARTKDLDIDLAWEDIAGVTAKRAGDPEIRQHGSRRTHVIRFIFDDADDVARFCAAASRAKHRCARLCSPDGAGAAPAT